MGQECQFLIFVGSTKMQFLNISSVFLALLESLFFAFFSCVFCGFGWAQTNPAQPNQPTQPSAARPASQPAHQKITNSVSICVKRSKNRLSEWYLADPKLTPKKSTGNHSRGRKNMSFYFLFVLRFSYFLGQAPTPKIRKFLTQNKIQVS